MSLGNWAVVVALLALLALSIVFVRLQRLGSTSRGLLAPTSIDLKPNLALIALPTALGAAVANRTAGLVLGLIVAIFVFANDGKGELSLGWPAYALPAIGSVVALRINPPATALTAILFIVGSVLVLRAVAISQSQTSAMASFVDGIGLFVTASLGLWLIGFRAHTGRSSGLHNSLTGGERIIFPLSNSLYLTAGMAAVYIAAAVPLILHQRKYRLVRTIAVLCGLIVFFLSNTRGAFLSCVLIVAVAVLIPEALRRLAPALVAIIMGFPFFYGAIQTAISKAISALSYILPGPLGQNLTSDASTLNRRDFIWARTLDFFWNHVDLTHQILGFGAFGHSKSGASFFYSVGLGGLSSDRSMISPHNSTLQLLFDGGWLAVLVVSGAMVAMSLALGKNGALTNIAGLGALLTLALVGLSESALGPSQAQPTWWMLMTLGAIAFAHKAKRVSVPLNEGDLLVRDD